MSARSGDDETKRQAEHIIDNFGRDLARTLKVLMGASAELEPYLRLVEAALVGVADTTVISDNRVAEGYPALTAGQLRAVIDLRNAISVVLVNPDHADGIAAVAMMHPFRAI